MARKASPINLSLKQASILSELANGTHTPLHYKTRAQYILLSAEGTSNTIIAQTGNYRRPTVSKWRNRWSTASPEINRVENETPHKLRSHIKSVLDDAPRPGCPQTFQPEQIAEIICLACTEPFELGLPFAQWTNSLLAGEAIRRGIVDTISPRHVGRILSDLDIHPQRYKGWLNPKIEDEEEFRANVQEVCHIYKTADQLEQDGTLVFSTDEMTGIQALEHCHPSWPAKPGHVERVEQEYIRHGTTTAIVSRSIASGEIVAPAIQDTRTEEDFVNHIHAVRQTMKPEKCIFIMDQLNTHKSEALVRYVINEEQLPIDQETLGIKGKSGILHSMETRSEFLSRVDHDIRIVYTPKHCSWLNQIEIWFSIVRRHLLNRRASFRSVEELRNRIRDYIEYYNEHLAKPFRWNYTGKLLQK